jgi:Sel1 repeat-containing protein
MCGARLALRAQDRPARVAVGASREAVASSVRLETLPIAAPVKRSPSVRAGSAADSRTPRRSYGAGTSFLGLNDRPGDVSYLLRDDASSHHVFRKLVLLAVLAGLGAWAYYQWRPMIQANPKAVTQILSAFAAEVNGWLHQTKPLPKRPASPGVESALTEDKQTAESKDAETPGAKDEGSQTAPPDEAPKQATAAPAVQGGKVKAHPAKAETEEVALKGNRKSSFAVVRARQYILGKGVPQNCEQALLYLRAAARRNDPDAAVQMGALYSNGQCVHQDRVMAYRWMNSAREQQPHNDWIQQNLDQLYARMTPQERKQIGN